MASIFSGFAKAQTPEEGNFSLQVSPSPILQVVKPGESKTVELNIRNNGNQKEELKMGLREFSVDENDGEIKLKESSPKDVENWVTFANPTFEVEAGTVYVQKITFNTPATAGFSYNFTVTVNRAKAQAPAPGQRAIEGTVAIFTLITVDRPGATRSFAVTEFTSERRLYEYLPAKFSARIRNTGNTIVQPFGNIFIQRSDSSSEPVSVIPLNSTGSYVLPNSSRVLKSEWDGGFPVFVTKQVAANAEPETRLVWDWGKAQNFRIGRYTAKMVAVYNDGQRDVPITTSVTFWVVPWKMLLVVFVILGLLIVGLTSIGRNLVRMAKPKKKHEHHTKESKDSED